MNRRKRRKHHPRSPRTQQFAASVLDLPCGFCWFCLDFGFIYPVQGSSRVEAKESYDCVSDGHAATLSIELGQGFCLSVKHCVLWAPLTCKSATILSSHLQLCLLLEEIWFLLIPIRMLFEIFSDLLEATPELNMNSSPCSDFLCRTSLGGRREPCCSLVLSHARCHLMQTKLQIYQMIMLHAGSGPLVITGSSQPTRPEGIQYISHWKPEQIHQM